MVLDKVVQRVDLRRVAVGTGTLIFLDVKSPLSVLMSVFDVTSAERHVVYCAKYLPVPHLIVVARRILVLFHPNRTLKCSCLSQTPYWT